MTDKRIIVNGREAGQINQDVLTIVKTSPDHFCKKYSGYGISVDVLYAAEARGASRIKFITYEGEEFILGIEEWRSIGIHADLGAGLQCFVSLKKLRSTAKNISVQQALQMSLFDGVQS